MYATNFNEDRESEELSNFGSNFENGGSRGSSKWEYYILYVQLDQCIACCVTDVY
jgi:hypothetical protein